MRLFGHPVHPLFVHFPTALLPMDLALSFLHFSNKDSSFALAGFYCLAAGTIAGFAALLSGLLDLLAIPRENKPALATGLYHGFINAAVILTFAVIAYKEWQAYPQLDTSAGRLAIKTILVITLFAGNYFGGRLIYQYHIGINKKQE